MLRIWSSLLPWIDHHAVENMTSTYHRLPATLQPDAKQLIRAVKKYEQLVNNVRDSAIIMTNLFAQNALNSVRGLYEFLSTKLFTVDFATVRDETCGLADALNVLRQGTQQTVEKCVDTFFTQIDFDRNVTERRAEQFLLDYSGGQGQVASVEQFNSEFLSVMRDILNRTDNIRNNVQKFRFPLYDCIHAAIQECHKELYLLWRKAHVILHFNPDTGLPEAADKKESVQNDGL